MVFSSIDSLFDAYQEHARVRGFSVVKRTLAKRNEREPKYALIVCGKAGTSKANKSSKKIDCKARLNAKKLDDESWIVTKMVNEHNHEIDPSFSPLMAAHKHLDIHIRRQLEANDIAGIRPCKNVRLLEVQSGGPENLGCLPKDCRNFIEGRRRLRLGDGDAEAIRKMFSTLQMKDKNFYHLMDIDEDGRLHNVLWIHPRNKAAYEDFHDVAGMISTQRSEGMHVFFDDFVHSRSTLKQFVEQYDIPIGNKIQKEFQTDFQSKNKVIKCITHFAWEKQFQKMSKLHIRITSELKVPRGRPRTKRFVSASEAWGCGRGGRNTSDATRISGRGGRRASAATRGTKRCNSRGGSMVASGPTHGNNNNDNEFLFDLNEDLNASQTSFV
ncbi:hypothetical protein ACS0TY_014584 [Phlomoides rotata]